MGLWRIWYWCNLISSCWRVRGSWSRYSICDSSDLWALKWISFFRKLLQQGQPPKASEDSRGSLNTGTTLSLTSGVACQGHSFQLRQRPPGPREREGSEHTSFSPACLAHRKPQALEGGQPSALVYFATSPNWTKQPHSHVSWDNRAPFPNTELS